MPKIRPTTELVVMSIIGLMTTLYETSTQNMNDTIREVWHLQFRSGATFGMESITKSVMTAIMLARGLSTHIYLAAYALMFYPFFFGRGITLLLLWMLICAIRSVIVNMFALLTGCIMCSYHEDLKPVCFEFTTTKAIELACSVYMWLSVNDFHIHLRSKRRSLVASRMFAKTTQISDSDLSLLSSDVSVTSYVDFDSDIADPSEDSIMVKAAVEWLMKMVFGSKNANRLVDADGARAQRFLNMTVEELRDLQNRIKEKLYADVGVDASERFLSDRESSVIVGPSDAEPSVGSVLKEDFEHDQVVSEPSTLEIESSPSTTKKKKSQQFDEEKQKVNKNLATLSTGSQTKQPSKKLRERLNQKQMSPKGSKVLDPIQKPSKEIAGKNALKSSSRNQQHEERPKAHVQGIIRSPKDRKKYADVDKKVFIENPKK